MKRRKFIHSLTALSAMTTLSSFKKFSDRLPETGEWMPVLFVGHGSPMNGIVDNEFSIRWKTLGKEIPRPAAVLCISAHWLTRGTFITAMEQPRTIHDFGGFPKPLYEVQYPAPGNPSLAAEATNLVTKTKVVPDHDWGLDHGTWSVVRQMYPDAKIPVLQLSIDYYKPAAWHYDLAAELKPLRKKGVLIIGSGNMVHNLGMAAWDRLNDEEFGYDWAFKMHHLFIKKINEGDHRSLVNYQSLSAEANLAIPTPDHYFPLLYSLALQGKNEQPFFFNEKVIAGSLNMTSVRFG